MVLLEHVPQLRFYELRQPLFQVRRYLTSILSMSVSYWKEMAILEPTEMWNSDPSILICLVWIGRRHTSFGSEGKLGHTISIHLLGVRSVVRELIRLKLLLGQVQRLLECWLSLWRLRRCFLGLWLISRRSVCKVLLKVLVLIVLRWEWVRS